MEETKYKCSECEKKVVIKDGEPIRTCDHESAVITANIQAVAYGQSSLK